ncbi:hypothetical protein NIES267_31150 [Calothrix parasitica NIES-267]|uniref:Uncharacterized protein n=1 Tax=Calothrix parasitica NIES-267 TaxID=1973488 RepID=A0A1Z4LQT7_9CYAN|nr:hypothetical protein NIES267_31150 [Calothrix parasitica NIES-267]
MKAIETTATINENGELTLDGLLEVTKPQRVRVIVLLSEDEEVDDSDETPTEEAIEGIHQGIREALSGQTIPLSQMWDGIDRESWDGMDAETWDGIDAE